jgi:hypothetical protein
MLDWSGPVGYSLEIVRVTSNTGGVVPYEVSWLDAAQLPAAYAELARTERELDAASSALLRTDSRLLSSSGFLAAAGVADADSALRAEHTAALAALRSTELRLVDLRQFIGCAEVVGFMASFSLPRTRR